MRRRDFFSHALIAGVAACSRTRAGIGSRQASTIATIPYNNWKAITYARNYCGKRQNSCGVYLDGPGKADCAHFLAHCLAAGGVRVRNTDPTNPLCPDGLAVRNTDLTDELSRLSRTYSNVKELGLTDAIIGDVGFLTIVTHPTHAFMLAEPVDMRPFPPLPVKVYAHTTNRCGEVMDAQWRQWFSKLFRITDAH